MKNFEDLIKEETVNEKGKFDLPKFSKQLEQWTDDNDHMSARLLCAKLCEDKRVYEVVQSINNICEYARENPISEYTYKVMTNVHTLGRKKYGKEEWDKYVYSNT